MRRQISTRQSSIIQLFLSLCRMSIYKISGSKTNTFPYRLRLRKSNILPFKKVHSPSLENRMPAKKEHRTGNRIKWQFHYCHLILYACKTGVNNKRKQKFGVHSNVETFCVQLFTIHWPINKRIYLTHCDTFTPPQFILFLLQKTHTSQAYLLSY